MRRIALLAIVVSSMITWSGLVGAIAVQTHVTARTSKSADFRGAVEIFNCSGALVRWEQSRPNDPAMMLTNGHCFQASDKARDTGHKVTRDVIVNQADSRPVTLLGRDGQDLGTVRAKRLLYSTAFKTDVGLYSLRRTFAEIRSEFHLRALTISDTVPAPHQKVLVPSGFSRKVYTCQLNGSVFKLHNDQFVWRHSLRLVHSATCHTIHGTSGSPLLARGTREVVGINNAINFAAGGPPCRHSLCEETADGHISTHVHRRYGQQTWWLTTCLGTDRKLDLDVEGCLLPKPPA
jgi:hypothetical protein